MNTIKDGEYTSTIYKKIRDGQYASAIDILNIELQKQPQLRATLSLLAYCYYHSQDFLNAADCYNQLSQICPDVDDYKLYYVMSLYKGGDYQTAMKASFGIENPAYQTKVQKIQAAIKYMEEDYAGAKSLVEQSSEEDDPDNVINMGCLLCKENQFEKACKKFQQAIQLAGYRASLSYNIALCHYRQKQYAPALKHIADVIERGIREHPELSVGMTTEGIDVRSVGNTVLLKETALVEAFNLKAAIEYQLKNYDAAGEALTDMPPRSEEELDPYTLHNMALMNMQTKATEGFEKLHFLLQQPTFPPETFGNLLLLYVKHDYLDLAADVLAEYSEFTYKYLTPFLYEFIDAVITKQTAPEEAFRKLDEMASRHIDSLRKLTKVVQEARDLRDEVGVKKFVTDYEEAMERYIPILMQQAKIYWDRDNCAAVERVFRKSVEFCNELDPWRLNVAHVLFMQDNKFKEATGFYEPIVKKHYDSILDVEAVVLANLCVSYIMTSQNEEAEELMRKIEKEEEQMSYEDPDRKIFHLCIVNIVIGTLYCAKGNFDFGISRVIKSLEPYNRKLGVDTWFYAKRCVLALLENLGRNMISLRDSILQEVIQFLEHCELHGKDIPVSNAAPSINDGPKAPDGRKTVAYEARLLKALFLEYVGWP
ncbi:intraflagellar transport protein 70A-like [Clavelina lepadiformis]|uniref:Tetratricopeptide repeat protein 30 n=1 Tax=Clavelina lepadiformis TaxID=159417 RepID=A0ABP0GHX6_CLALP